MGAMPLPRGTQLEGLATAIYELMERRKIPFNFGYMAGAELRVTALLNRKYDFIIASKATANTVLQQCDDLLEVLQDVYKRQRPRRSAPPGRPSCAAPPRAGGRCPCRRPR